MADNTITIAFETDTSGLASGIDQVNTLFEGMVESASASSNAIDGFFGTMEKASGQILNGILQGTQTWQQAVTRVLGSMLASYINTFAWIPLNWIRNELAMTAATEEGNAVRTASTEAASSATIGAQSESAMAAIFNDAKQVFAGIFAFLAPTMGPAAAGPAAAGSAEVLAGMGGIQMLETGSWNIPNDSFAYLHAGEMVVPQSFASSLRENGGIGGGDSYTININAIDTQTGAQFLKNNASVIANTLSSQVRNFNRNVPLWKG